MTSSLILRALFGAALFWGMWPLIMKQSMLHPVLKNLIFAGVTLGIVAVPVMWTSRAELAGNFSWLFLGIAILAGVSNGIGTANYQWLLAEVPKQMTSVFAVATLVMIVAVTAIAGVVVNGEKITWHKLLVFGLATLTILAASLDRPAAPESEVTPAAQSREGGTS